METLRIKESLRSYPEISQPLSSTHDPGGRTVLGSVGWVVLLFISFPIAWHVIILCACVKSHPLPKENPAPEGQTPFHGVLTTGMLHQKDTKARLGHPSQENLFHLWLVLSSCTHPSPSQRRRRSRSVFSNGGQLMWPEIQTAEQQRQEDRKINVSVNVCYQRDCCEPS